MLAMGDFNDEPFDASLRANPAFVQIPRPSAMVDTGVQGKPVRSAAGRTVNESGLSDHFPITMTVT